MDWELVKDQIVKAPTKDNTMPMYYAGGTLCIDIPSGLLCLNLNGHGFSIIGEKEEQFIQPMDVLKLVRALYVETKGETRYYKKEILGNRTDIDHAYIFRAVQKINIVCGNVLTVDQVHEINLICQDIVLHEYFEKPGAIKSYFLAACTCKCPICEKQKKAENSKA